MKLKTYKILMIIFGMLTIIGAGYIFYTGGQTSAGFAVVPMLFCISFSTSYHNEKKKQNK